MNLGAVGKLHPAAAMRAVPGWDRSAVGTELGGSAERLLSPEDAASLLRLGPLEAESKGSVPRPEPRREKPLHFGYGVLVWGYTSLLTMSHSRDRGTG